MSLKNSQKNRFEDLEVWKKSYSLCIDIYKSFKSCDDFGFKNQITLSSLSIPSNIAEGHERKHNKEFMRFLHIAKGSAGELRTQLNIAIEINYVGKKEGYELIQRSEEVSSMIAGLIKSRNKFEEEKAKG